MSPYFSNMIFSTGLISFSFSSRGFSSSKAEMDISSSSFTPLRLVPPLPGRCSDCLLRRLSYLRGLLAELPVPVSPAAGSSPGVDGLDLLFTGLSRPGPLLRPSFSFSRKAGTCLPFLRKRHIGLDIDRGYLFERYRLFGFLRFFLRAGFSSSGGAPSSVSSAGGSSSREVFSSGCLQALRFSGASSSSRLWGLFGRNSFICRGLAP